MVFILAESSLHHALETLTCQKNNLREKLYSIPGLSLNTYTKKYENIEQNLLDVQLKDKNNVVNWHEVIYHSTSRHKSNEFRSLSVPDLLAILNQLQDSSGALVYCQRDRPPHIAEE